MKVDVRCESRALYDMKVDVRCESRPSTGWDEEIRVRVIFCIPFPVVRKSYMF